MREGTNATVGTIWTTRASARWRGTLSSGRRPLAFVIRRKQWRLAILRPLKLFSFHDCSFRLVIRLSAMWRALMLVSAERRDGRDIRVDVPGDGLDNERFGDVE
jgi:hypothetical protein